MYHHFTPSTAAHTLPLSPTSPGIDAFKPVTSSPRSIARTPQSPSSPSLMSLATQRHVSHFSPQSSPDQMASQSQLNRPYSPPTTTGTMSSETSQQLNSSHTNSFPTPASSVGHPTAEASGSYQQDQKNSTGAQTQLEGVSLGQDAMDIDSADHRRNDHDTLPPNSSLTLSAPSSNNPNESVMDMGGVAMTASQQAVSALQKDVGSAYLLCRESHTRSGPDPNYDLLSVYGLAGLVSTVARVDPFTGEKINRLRKSYEGKIKTFALSGRNKPVKDEGSNAPPLRQFMAWPEEEWTNQKVFGKEIRDFDGDMLSKLSKAMDMEKGSVPNNDYWEDLLGHEKIIRPGSLPPKKINPNFNAVRSNIGPNGVSSPRIHVSTPREISSGIDRPRRVGKKRSYADSSFDGYGDGFDDEGDVASNGESSAKKKRRMID